MKISGLVKRLLVGSAIVVSTILPNKLKAQIPDWYPWYDAFSPKNEVVNYFGSYGSGDVDQDGDVDADDLTAMNTMQNFYSDVDADGQQSTAQDKQVLEEYLNGNRQYMPAEYWRSTTEEKKDWVSKIYPIMTELNDQSYVHSDDINERFTSDNFGIQDFLTGNGYSPNRDDFGLIHSKYEMNYNGLFNLPIYITRVHSDDGIFNHGISAIFTGTNLNDVDDWVFFEPQHGVVVEPGIHDGSIPYNSKLSVFGVHDFESAYNGGVVGQPRLVPAVYLHIDSVGNREMTYINPNMVVDKTTLSVGGEKNKNIPENYSLEQNYPNPFNSSTIIQFTVSDAVIASGAKQSQEITSLSHRNGISRNDKVVLKIYDITGKEITTLFENINTSGFYSVEWNASGYPSGIYFYQLQSNSEVLATRKMLLLR